MDLGAVDHLLTITRSVRRRLDLARAVEPRAAGIRVPILARRPCRCRLGKCRGARVQGNVGADQARTQSLSACRRLGSDTR